MSDLPPDDTTPTAGARPKRPPPTLDLSATEIPQPGPTENEPADAAKPARKPSRVLIPALSGAIAGALVAAAAILAQWPVGSAPEPSPGAATAANNAALDEIRARVAKLEARPALTPAAPVDLGPTMQRLDALDKGLAAVRAENEALRAQTAQALAAATEARSSATASGASPAAVTDLGPIDARLTQLEAAQRAQVEKAADQSRRPAADAALRLAVVAVQLDALVRQGEPYAATLAAAKPLASDAAALRPLEAFAASGVPNAARLSAELLAIPQLAPAPIATSAGLIERMRAGATKLVKIERTDADPTDNAAIGRATTAARRNDAATAIRELAALPANDRVAVQPWLDRATAADAARSAARQFAEQAIAAAAKPAP